MNHSTLTDTLSARWSAVKTAQTRIVIGVSSDNITAIDKLVLRINTGSKQRAYLWRNQNNRNKALALFVFQTKNYRLEAF